MNAQKGNKLKAAIAQNGTSFESWLQLHNLGLVAVEVVRLQLVAQQSVLFQTFSPEGFAHR
jgi:hypothetical protein